MNLYKTLGSMPKLKAVFVLRNYWLGENKLNYIIKKYILLIALVIDVLPIFSQNNEILYYEKDSTLNFLSGNIYEFRFYKKDLLKSQFLYKLESETVYVIGEFQFKNAKFNYFSFLLYDEPTGRVFTLVYDFLNSSFYKSDWFDDKANGDFLLKEKVNFKGKYLIIKEKNKNKFYKVNLNLIAI